MLGTRSSGCPSRTFVLTRFLIFLFSKNSTQLILAHFACSKPSSIGNFFHVYVALKNVIKQFSFDVILGIERQTNIIFQPY